MEYHGCFRGRIAVMLQQQAFNELREMEAVATQYAKRFAVVPLLNQEPIGVDRLLELAGHTI